MKIVYRKLGIMIIDDTSDCLSLSNELAKFGYYVSYNPLKNNFNRKKNLIKAINIIESSYYALREKCDEIIIIGASYGTLLTLQLASKIKVKGLILWNPPFLLKNFLKNLKTVLIYLISLRIKKIYSIYSINKLVKNTRKILSKIDCEIFINQIIDNNYPNFKNADYFDKEIKCSYKKNLLYKNNHHELSNKMMIDLVRNIELI